MGETQTFTTPEFDFGGIKLQIATDEFAKAYARQQILAHETAYMKREHEKFPDESLHFIPGDILTFNFTRLDYGIGACRLIQDDHSEEKNIAMVVQKGVIVPSFINSFYEGTNAVYRGFNFRCPTLYRFTKR